MYISCILLFVSIDILLHQIFTFKKQECYYLMHFFFNIFVTFQTTPLLYYSLTGNKLFFELSYDFVGNLITSFHVYHIIRYYRYFKLMDDVVHHITAFLLIYLAIYNQIDGVASLAALFMTGAPGAAYYGPLFLSLNGLISKDTQKYINFCASFIRCTGIIYATTVGDVLWTLNYYQHTSLYYIIFSNIINLWNGLYFHYKVIEDYVITKHK